VLTFQFSLYECFSIAYLFADNAEQEACNCNNSLYSSLLIFLAEQFENVNMEFDECYLKMQQITYFEK